MGSRGCSNGFRRGSLCSGLFSHSPRLQFSNATIKKHCSDFVTSALADLLRANAIMKWASQPRCVLPLNVATRSNGKQRLILDMRHVNEYLMIPKFRIDSLKLLSDLADLDDLMFSLDLASGYHQVDMDPRYYTYLGFEWQGQFYVFKVLPFGLASAPWCFTKIMRAISMHLRFRGVRLVNYLDDFLCVVKESQAKAHRQLILTTFEAAGLAINRAIPPAIFTYVNPPWLCCRSGLWSL